MPFRVFVTVVTFFALGAIAGLMVPPAYTYAFLFAVMVPALAYMELYVKHGFKQSIAEIIFLFPVGWLPSKLYIWAIWQDFTRRQR